VPSDIRVVSEACPACNGDGRFDVVTGYDPRDGSSTGYTMDCTSCSGEGGFEEEVAFEPIGPADLDEVFGGDPADHWPGCLPDHPMTLPME